MLEPAIKNKGHWWHREDVLLLVLLAILYLLPGLQRIPLFDRDEPRFAVAARNMLETGDYIVPRFNGNLRPDKPPLVYWLMDIGYTLTGGTSPAHELGARLPSAFCAMLTLIAVYFFTGARFGRLTGFVAAMMLGSCVMFVTWGRLATADSTMLLFIVLCMGIAWRAWDAAGIGKAGGHGGNGRVLPRADFLLDRSSDRMLMLDHMPEQMPRPLGFMGAMLFWISLAAGTLTKGVPLLFVLVPMIALSFAPAGRGGFRWKGNWAWWRSLRPLVGVPLLIVLVGWWVLLAGHATDWQLIKDMWNEHFVNRVAGTSEGMKHYGMPPGFFFATVWGMFFPWSILIVPAAYHTLRRVRGKTPISIDPRPYQFLLAWIVPMWLLLEMARGKLVHYSLPLMPALAILCADTLVQSWYRLTDVLAAPWFKSLRWGMLLLWVGMGVALLVAAKGSSDPAMLWRCVPFAAGLVATGIVSAITWGKPSWPYVLVLAWGGSLFMADTMLLGELPEIQVSRIAAGEMKEMKTEMPGAKFGVLGYEEATLVFYTGSEVKRFGTVEEMMKEVPFGTPADVAKYPWVIVIDEKSRLKLDGLGVAYTRLPRIDMPADLSNRDPYIITGFNPANFSPVMVSVITNAVPKATTERVDISPSTTATSSP